MPYSHSALKRRRTDTRNPRRYAQRSACAVAALAVSLLAPVAIGKPAEAMTGLEATKIGTFERPVYMIPAPGDDDHVYVVEQGGRILLMDDGLVRKIPFLDIRDRVFGPGDEGSGFEQGLLSIAFPEDHAQSRLFYVAYTNKKGDLRIDEYRRKSGDQLTAKRSSRRKVIRIKHREHQNHNGGHILFGPDGFLYITTGDGGGQNDIEDNARKLNKLLGKRLRIKPEPSTDSSYSIPKTNPFRKTNGRDEIYAYGVRNLWRMAFFKNRMILADVGQGAREEINIVKRAKEGSGANFGWPEWEGDIIHDEDRPGPDPAVFPQIVLKHNDGNCSITGGLVLQDPRLPDYMGRYFYADFCDGEVFSVVPKTTPKDNKSTGITLDSPTSFGFGPDGEMYVSEFGGGVYRIDPPSQ